MNQWVSEINKVAAVESAPPLPAPVTSMKGHYQRPALPESKSTETPAEILERLKVRMLWLFAIIFNI